MLTGGLGGLVPTRRQFLWGATSLALAPVAAGCALTSSHGPLVGMEYETWFTCAVGVSPSQSAVVTQAVDKQNAVKLAAGGTVPGLSALERQMLAKDVDGHCATRPGVSWARREATPVLGTYESASPTVIKQHASWIAGAGVDFLLIDWSNNFTGKNWTNGVALGIMSATYALAQTYRTLSQKPRFALLVGLDNAQAGTSLFMEQVDLIWNMFIQAPEFRSLYQTFLGKPLLGVYTGPRSSPPPAWNDSRFTVRWVNGFNETTHGNKLGYWSWIDRVPQVTYRAEVGPHGAKPVAEAVTVAAGWPGFGPQSQNGWGLEGARNHGQTYLNQWSTAFQARPEVVLLCQWNEFIQPDQYSVEESNDMEPTALDGYGYHGNGGWGIYYVDLTATMVRAFKAGKPQPHVKLNTAMP